MWFAQTAEPVVTSVTTVTTTGTSSGGLWAGLAAMWFIWLAIFIVMIIGMWKIFEKAGEEGWKSIIPLYNTYTLFRIAGRNGWGFLLLYIPIVQFVVWIMISLDIAKHYGKSTMFAIFGLILFPYIGYLMLGFGDAKYVGTKHE